MNELPKAKRHETMSKSAHDSKKTNGASQADASLAERFNATLDERLNEDESQMFSVAEMIDIAQGVDSQTPHS